MVDDRRPTPDETAPPGRPPGATAPDETTPPGGAAAPDETAPMARSEGVAGPRPPGSAAPDETAPMARSGGPGATAPLDASGGRVDATRTMPAVPDGPGGGGPGEGQPARWSGSASVPPPGAVPVRGPAYEEYEEYGQPADPDAERSWVTPVVVGVLALVLVIALVTGLWLVFTLGDGGPDAPVASPTAAAPSSAPSSAPTRTTAPPSSARPTSVAPATTSVPEVIGLPEAQARQRLADAGLVAAVVRRVDGSVEPGTVLDANPKVGTEVAANSVVRLVVAVAPPPSSPSASSGG